MKKAIVIVCVIALVLMLIPIRVGLKDGGSVKYQSVLYSVTDVHCILDADMPGFEEGIIVRILGFKVYDNVKLVPDDT